MPDMGAWCNKQGLARCDGHETDGTLRSMHGGGVALFSSLCEITQTLVGLFVEVIQALLPAAIAFDTDLDAAEDHLLAAAKIDAQLDDVAVLDTEGLGLDVGLAEANVVEERARGALDVSNVPAAVLVPQFAVLAADHLGFEADRGGRGGVRRHVGQVVALRVAANTDQRRLVGQRAGNGRELERGSAGARVLVGNEADRGEVLGICGADASASTSARRE